MLSKDGLDSSSRISEEEMEISRVFTALKVKLQ